MELKGRVCVITGGIGRAMAKAFLAHGAKTVVLADLDGDALQVAVKDLGNEGRGCEGQVCDVRREADAQRC